MIDSDVVGDDEAVDVADGDVEAERDPDVEGDGVWVWERD